jgi:hypothetical protein
MDLGIVAAAACGCCGEAPAPSIADLVIVAGKSGPDPPDRERIGLTLSVRFSPGANTKVLLILSKKMSAAESNVHTSSNTRPRKTTSSQRKFQDQISCEVDSGGLKQQLMLNSSTKNEKRRCLVLTKGKRGSEKGVDCNNHRVKSGKG